MEIPRLPFQNTPWLEIYTKFVLVGRPFILESDWSRDWSSRKEWVRDGNPNLIYLVKEYGEARVPVVKETDGDVLEMSFREYVEYCSVPKKGNGSLYLKDWHFQKECNGSAVYSPPPFLSTDWLNNESWTDDLGNPVNGDYRFLYFGHKGTWTGFHSDVLSTHSWSANICGRKLWYVVPRGNESAFKEGKDYIKDIRTKKELWITAKVVTFVQEAGEIVFIPSNFYHQVHNLEATISLNHNSINASNIQLVWEFLKQRVVDIKEEIGHLDGIFSGEEMKQQIQLILNADARLDYSRLSQLLDLIIRDRLSHSISPFHCLSHPDPRLCQSQCFSSPCDCSTSTCDLCLSYLHSYDLSVAQTIQNEVKGLI